MNTSKSLDEIFATLNGSGAHACYCERSTDGGCKCALKDEYLVEAKQAIVEAVEGIYGDSDGLREFAGLNLIKPVPEVPSKRKDSMSNDIPQTDKPQHDLNQGESPDFISELVDLINKHSRENQSDTPDYILARYLQHCLGAWNVATRERDRWHNFKPFARLEADDTGNDLVASDKEARNG